VCKKLTLVLVITLLLVLPVAVHAKRPALFTAALVELEYTNLGVITVKRAKDVLTLQTTGLVADAVLDCGEDTGCHALELHGRGVRVWQVARLDIDHTSAGYMPVTGRTGVELSLLSQQGAPVGPRMRFKGKVTGTAFKGTDEELHVDDVRGINALSGEGGTLTISLSGTLGIFDGAAAWQELVPTAPFVLTVTKDIK
jgi:hypothetical protein